MPPDIKCVSPTFSAFCSGPAVTMTVASYAETVPAHRHCTAALVAGLLSSATGGSREGEHSQRYDKAGFCPAPISPSSTRASGASGCDQRPASSVPGQGEGAQGGRAARSPRVCLRRSCPGGVCGGCWRLAAEQGCALPRAPRRARTAVAELAAAPATRFFLRLASPREWPGRHEEGSKSKCPGQWDRAWGSPVLVLL